MQMGTDPPSLFAAFLHVRSPTVISFQCGSMAWALCSHSRLPQTYTTAGIRAKFPGPFQISFICTVDAAMWLQKGHFGISITQLIVV